MTSSNLIGRAYFARFHTSKAAGPPTDGAVFVYFSSSPARVKFVRLCSVPFQFGKELPMISMLIMRSGSLTERLSARKFHGHALAGKRPRMTS